MVRRARSRRVSQCVTRRTDVVCRASALCARVSAVAAAMDRVFRAQRVLEVLYSPTRVFSRPRRAQPRKGIHPLLHKLTVVATNGATHRVRTSVKQLGDYLFLALDANNHPAYTGRVIKGPATGQAAKFKRKFDFLNQGVTAGKKR